MDATRNDIDGPTQAEVDPVRQKILMATERAERERPHVEAVHDELTRELGRPPVLRELAQALRDRRGVERTRKSLARDLATLGLPRWDARQMTAREAPPERRRRTG